MKPTLLGLTLATVAGGWLLSGAGSSAAAADGAAPAPGTDASYLSPAALAVTSDGQTLYIACATAREVLEFDTGENRIRRRLATPQPPSGLTLAADGARLYVTCAAPESQVCIVDTKTCSIQKSITAGYAATAPVLSPDGKTLYVCNRFQNYVSFLDLESGREVRKVAVPREPVGAAVTGDGRYLLVANHIQAGRADADYVASSVSVIDTAAGKVVKEIVLPNGSTLLRGVCRSPDGKYACVVHSLGRFHLPTTQVDRGWINSNALSLIDLARMELINTVLLDNIGSGAANPWAVAWTADGRSICVTHAGTHEVSIVDAPALLKKLASLPATLDPSQKPDYSAASVTTADVPNDLSFVVGLRQRIALPGKGPRALALAGQKLYVANYYSDALSRLDLAAERISPQLLSLGPARALSVLRTGEMLANDATLCFQGWQSCGSCHSEDMRVDGLNWDLLNDGIGNPKNSKSLLFSHKTPPAMSLGVRATAEIAVRAGIRHSLFTVQPDEVALAMDEYLKALQPMPSPYLEKGKLTAAAERGEKLFLDAELTCAQCHVPGLLTDLQSYDVGTASKYDKPTDKFDTPTLVELWRTAPYLHDGSAVTLHEVLTVRNLEDKHGKTSHLTQQQFNDLVAYLLSL